MTFIQPRRFGEMWQMAEDFPGTLGQQQAVRNALTPVYGTPFHQVTQKMDRWINAAVPSRSYLPVAFQDLGEWFLGRGGYFGISLSFHLNDATIIENQALHEMGHVYDQLGLLSQEDKWWFMDKISGNHNGSWPHEYQETWAEAFRMWASSDAQVWPDLTAVLLRT